MAQTFTSDAVTGTTVVKTDNINSRVNENTLRSNFSGTSFPDNPVLGQHCYREDMDGREWKWNGTSWVDIDINSSTQKDVTLSSGNLPTLRDRMAVSINDDGTLKTSPATAIDEFKDNALVITYVSTNSFTTSNDLTSTFTQYRKVKCVLSASYVITSVTASTYDSGTNKTTVTLKDSVIDPTITEVKYGVIQSGLPDNVMINGSNVTAGTANITTLNMTGGINGAVATIATASTMDISGANYIIATGTTPITAFSEIKAGAVRTIRFTGVTTLTYNTSTFILPTSSNITTAVGDVAVFIDGGSGVWTCIGYQRFDGSALSGGNKIAIFNETQPSGTAGGTFTSGAWRTRTLNTTVTNNIGATLSSNQITLLAGSYKIEATAPAYGANTHKIRFQNITDSTTSIVGSSEWATGNIQTISVLSGVVTISSSKVFELQHRCGNTASTQGFGVPNTFDVSEVYSEVKIEKVG